MNIIVTNIEYYSGYTVTYSINNKAVVIARSFTGGTDGAKYILSSIEFKGVELIGVDSIKTKNLCDIIKNRFKNDITAYEDDLRIKSINASNATINNLEKFL